MAPPVDVAVDVMRKLVMLLLVVIMSVTSSMGQQMCDHCNCQISTLTESQAIHSLTLVCNTGTITWFGASGAVRIELTPFLRGNFRACFLADPDNTQVKIYQENANVIPSGNYHLKMEGSRTLKLDHLLTSSAKSREFCVNAKNNEPVLLYMEAVRTPGVDAVPKIVFHYDMEKLDTQALTDPMIDCRPCSKEELLDSYCSMDFVVVGGMAQVRHIEDTDQANITLAVKQVIHQRDPHLFQRIKRSDPHLTGHVTVPRRCGMGRSEGDFLMTGRVRLNSLTLKCAVYMHEWRQMQHEVECSHS